MQSRYLHYSFCMERAFGQGWLDREKVPHRLSRWGVTIATATGLDAASPVIRSQDARCRRENEVKPLAEDRGDGTPK